MKVLVPVVLAFSLATALSAHPGAFAITAPDGGSSFESAEPIGEGQYSNTPIPEGTDFYYSLEIPVGHELTIDYTYIEDTYTGTITLYGENREELVADDQSSGTLRWLNGNTPTPETNYYLVMSNWYEINAFTLDIQLTERSEADSGEDAGDNFEHAVLIDYGSHEGYISSFIYGPEGGNDTADYYKIEVESGDTVTFRVTPEGMNTAGLAVFDENRGELYNNDGLDLSVGEIAQTSVDIEEDGYIYAAVKWPDFNSGDAYIFKYTLLISTEAIEDQSGTATGDEDADNEGTGILSENGDDENRTGGISSSLKTLLIIGFICVLFILLIIAAILVIKMMTKKKSGKEGPDPAEKKETPKIATTETANKGTPTKSTPPKEEKKPSVTVTDTPVESVNKRENDETPADDTQKVSITVEEGTKVEVNTVPEKKKN